MCSTHMLLCFVTIDSSSDQQLIKWFLITIPMVIIKQQQASKFPIRKTGIRLVKRCGETAWSNMFSINDSSFSTSTYLTISHRIFLNGTTIRESRVKLTLGRLLYTVKNDTSVVTVCVHFVDVYGFVWRIAGEILAKASDMLNHPQSVANENECI